MNEPWQKVVVGASLAAVMLLVVANFLLLNILSDDDQVASEAEAPVPVLKTEAAAKGTSNRALLRELDRAGRRLETPLEQAIADLDSVETSTTSLQTMPALLSEMIIATEELSAVAPQFTASAKRLKSIDKEFRKLSGYVEGLGSVLVDLEKTMSTMSADIARIRQCNEKPSEC